ncbi:MAG: cell division protein ZapE [Gammaproteobacteria bacterium]|nr:MAG: cell division protein ZapE [Gammaproteobacteria bacterium]
MDTYTKKWRDDYHAHLEKAGYQSDPAQLAVVDELARIEYDLAHYQAPEPTSSGGWLSRLFRQSDAAVEPVKGLYVYGTVGRGKTFLMDLFCDHLAENTDVATLRLHFHHFMKRVHDELRGIKDQADPLIVVADNLAKQCRVLCLDEFMVTDITDAMLLYGLLKYLTDHGVVIVTTSNIIPDDLYKNGLQRERFLPAIPLIKSRLVVHEIGNGQDFRRLKLEQHARFFHPLNDATQAELQSIFDELSEHLYVEKQGNIEINGRDIAFVARSEEVIWFDFETLCEGFRSQLDYIELAKQFPVFIVSNIPLLDELKEDAAKRFLLLVDELYDRRIDLILSSAVAVEEIYTGKRIAFEFDRLQSRLFEMQSKNYGKQ